MEVQIKYMIMSTKLHLATICAIRIHRMFTNYMIKQYFL
jgi:hypothetical protein